ncbi:MAG: hypothetical protein ABFR97_02500 [Thermodesulfobacteriota bacterium]
MRCPKCDFISFDHITSCSKCSNDLTEITASLRGTGFQSLEIFFLGGLIADHGGGAPMGLMPDFDQDIPDMPVSEDLGDPSDLSIDLGDLQGLGDLPDMADSDLGSDLGLGDMDLPEVDLDEFDDEDSTMFVSGKPSAGEEDMSLDDLTEADLGDIDLEGFDFEDDEPAAPPEMGLADIDLGLGDDEQPVVKKSDNEAELPDLKLE